MAAAGFSTPFQPYVYQSQLDTFTAFQILGGDSQIVQIMLKPLEKVTAKPGSMCYMSGSIQMDAKFPPEQEGSIWQWLFGKTMTSIVLSNTGTHDGFVGIATPSPARIFPIDLANFGGEILCQSDAFLCCLDDVTVSNTVDQRARILLPGAEGILRQKLTGRGLAFLTAGGSFAQKTLEAGEVLVVDASSIVAMTSGISSQIKKTGPIRRAVFGGENQTIACLTGPGIVFIQSLPFHRLSQRIARAVTTPGMRENPKILIQVAIFFFIAYFMIISSLMLADT